MVPTEHVPTTQDDVGFISDEEGERERERERERESDTETA
jgi:hypothetical protein